MPPIKIERGVPLVKHGGRRPWKYDWDNMKVGDSFLVEDIPNDVARSSAWRAGKQRGWKFVTRKQHDGTRIYRDK